MLRAIIVHGWDGHPQEGWFPWLKEELEKNGFRVQVPAMPHPETPTIEDWVATLAGAVGTPDGQTYLIGHSMGCQTILRYLAGLPEGSRVGGVVLVAGFLLPLTNNEDPETARPWIETPINTEQVKAVAPKIAAIFSPTDHYVPLANKEVFEQRLGAKTMVVDGVGKKGHFSGGDGVTQLPQALAAVLEMMSR